MLTKAISLTLTLFLTICILIPDLGSQKVIVVDGKRLESLNEAIKKASPGQLILVKTIRLTESRTVVIDKPVHIKGAIRRGLPRIMPGPRFTGNTLVLIKASGVVIEDLRLEGWGRVPVGVTVQKVQNVTLNNLKLSWFSKTTKTPRGPKLIGSCIYIEYSKGIKVNSISIGGPGTLNIGIRIFNSSKIEILNSTIEKCEETAIRVGKSSNITINNVSVERASIGGMFYLTKGLTINRLETIDCNHSLILDHVFNGNISRLRGYNTAWIALKLKESKFIHLNDCIWSHTRYGIMVEGIEPYDFIHSFRECKVNEKDVVYLVNSSNIVVKEIEPAFLGVVISRNVTIKNIKVSGSGQGILLAYVHNSSITGCELIRNYYGIYAYKVKGVNITHNKFELNGVKGEMLSSGGLFLQGSRNLVTSNTFINNNATALLLIGASFNTVSGNRILNNVGNGIYLTELREIIRDVERNQTIVAMYDARNNTLVGNQVKYNSEEGISILSANNNIIINNVIEGNNASAIGVYRGSVNNTILGNKIYEHTLGIIIAEGSSNNLIINNTILNNGNGVSVALNSAQGNHIKNNTIGSAVFGVKVDMSKLNTIFLNKISGNVIGIHLNFSDLNSVSSNELSNNTYPLVLTSSVKNKVRYNAFRGRAEVSVIAVYSHRNEFKFNKIRFGKIGILLNSSFNNIFEKNLIESNRGEGIIIVNSNGTVLRWNSFSNNAQRERQYNIYAYRSNLTQILSNMIKGGRNGILVWDSRACDLLNNTLVDLGECGIRIMDSHAIKTIDNNITNARKYGIHLIAYSLNHISNHIVIGNHIKGSWCGIYLEKVINSNITGNEVADSGSYAIYLKKSSHNIVKRNTISAARFCGLYLDDSSNNQIISNIFKDVRRKICGNIKGNVIKG